MAFSGDYERNELRRILIGRGGLVAHAGTNDLRQALAEDKPGTALVIEAMALQTAREIAAGMAVLASPPDAVLVTGNMAHSDTFVALLKKSLAAFMNIVVMPGSFEMEALSSAVQRVLGGKEEPRDYVSDPEHQQDDTED
jgi:butyrate kinase